MIPISLPYIYDLSTSLHPIRYIQHGTPLKESLFVLWGSENSLNAFLTKSVYSATLKATVAPGTELLASIKKLTTDSDKDRLLDFYDTFSLTSGLDKFETVLTAELNVGNAYLVTPKRGFDTSTLITQAEILLCPEFVTLVPEAVGDIREAGKCLAFELSTASGFHIMRATELVVRHYWDIVTNGKPRPDRFNLGDYLREMDNLKVGDKKIKGILRQIKDLHRNELMHPEVSLDLDEAIALLGIAQSAIASILKELLPKTLSLP